MNNTYQVTWVIEVDADSPRKAACLAQRIQRDLDSEATVFEVKNLTTGSIGEIDLYKD